VKIERVRLRVVEIPLRFAFETSFGRWTDRRGLLVELHARGLTGYGEVTAHDAPLFSYETIDTARDVIRSFIVPLLLRHDLTDAEAFGPLIGSVRGHPMAKAGVEGALRDLLAKERGESLAAQIGGTRSHVDSGVSLGIEPDPAGLVSRARPFADAGYKRIKAKIRPGWDVEPVKALRETFPSISLAADANAAYLLSDASQLEELDAFDLAMIEQPLAWDDLVDHAELAKRLRTPLCLDESLTGLSAARAAASLGSGAVFNIKLGRVGGMSEAVSIHNFARDNGIPVWCGGMLETCVGRLHNIALASLPGFTMPGDLSGTDRYFEIDLVEPAIRVGDDGTLAVPSGPGIGADIIPELLERVTVYREDLAGGASA